MFQKRSCCQSTASSSEPSQPAAVSTCSQLQIYFKTPRGMRGKVSGYQEWQRFLVSFCFLYPVTTLGQVQNRGLWPLFLELDIFHYPLGLSLFWLENKQEHTVEISGILVCDFMYISPSEVDENTPIKLQSKPSSKVHNKAWKLLISSCRNSRDIDQFVPVSDWLLANVPCWL